MNNLKAERTLTAERIEELLKDDLHDRNLSPRARCDLAEALIELQHLRSQYLSTQQPMGEVTDKVWFSVLDCPHEITGNEIVLRYAATKEGRNAADQLRMRISAALHPNQESGE